MKTTAVIWPAAGEVEVGSCELPELQPGEVLLEAECTLISPGTERAWFLGLPNTASVFPRQTGYNFAGRVAAVGSQVDGFAVGDRVVTTGHHAQHAVAAAGAVYPIPEGLDTETAVFFFMGAIALQGVRRPAIQLGESVAVIGQGLIGLMALQLCRLHGALPLVAIDTDASRLEMSHRSGADVLVDSSDDQRLEALVQELDGGPAVVIEATGHPEPINTAFELVRPHGRVVLLASTRGTTEVNFYTTVHMKGNIVYGAHNGARPDSSRPGAWTQADDALAVLQLLKYGRLQVEHLISHRFPAAQAADAYEMLKQWDPSLVGVLLKWG